jgi:hypothetical protein
VSPVKEKALTPSQRYYGGGCGRPLEKRIIVAGIVPALYDIVPSAFFLATIPAQERLDQVSPKNVMQFSPDRETGLPPKTVTITISSENETREAVTVRSSQ